MKHYDVVVVGKGASQYIISKAAQKYDEIAVIDSPPIGGTCMNFGCIPTKTLVYPADRIRDIVNSDQLGIDADMKDANFIEQLKKVRKARQKNRQSQQEYLDQTVNIDYYSGEGYFTDKYTLEVKGQKLSGDKIFLANGARPFIPPIRGVEDIDYLTNESILELTQKPKSIIIVGGGYISLEYAHILSAFGIDITVLERQDRLMSNMEPEISKLLEKEVRKFADLRLNTTAREISSGDGITVIADSPEGQRKIQGERLFLATGRKSNADTLNLENTNIKVDEREYIKVNRYLETDQKKVWAIGDIIGKDMLKHIANHEARIAWHNANNPEKKEMRYHASPKVIFTHPEIGSVGLTEKQARKGHSILIGKARFNSVRKGSIMKDYKGFVKVIVNKKDRKLLGFHIIGPQASILLQEAALVIANRGKIDYIINSIHTFPALSEIVLKPLLNLEEPEK
ncbi:MAG: dihydrolipoyl dehydrogenase [Candidatus Marinimicrobia bacterium]|nr:dihydrolipoyl dehydrogenase [Candidatus Neomarinimicrobiota bacterium]